MKEFYAYEIRPLVLILHPNVIKDGLESGELVKREGKIYAGDTEVLETERIPLDGKDYSVDYILHETHTE